MQYVCILLLAAGIQAMAQHPPSQASEAKAAGLLRDAIATQQKGDSAKAIGLYRDSLQIDPSQVEALADLGELLVSTGNAADGIEQEKLALAALATDKRVRDRAAAEFFIRKNLARNYFSQGDLAQAHAECMTLHDAQPKDLETAILLAKVDLNRQRAQEAVDLLAPLEAANESNLELEYGLAVALVQSGNESAGLPRLEKVAQTTRSASAFALAGGVRLNKNQFAEARADFHQALAINPSLPGLQSMAGRAELYWGDQAKAVSLLQSALKQDPMDSNANLCLGTIRLDQHDLADAKPLLDLALQLNPQSQEIRYELAKWTRLSGDLPQAVKILEAIVKAQPNWLDPHVDLAALYYKLHRPEDGQHERDIIQKIEDQEQKSGPKKP
jgi:tetratricopeptide (TPR) repeat protein